MFNECNYIDNIGEGGIDAHGRVNAGKFFKKSLYNAAKPKNRAYTIYLPVLLTNKKLTTQR
jgi:hypothetical protein